MNISVLKNQFRLPSSTGFDVLCKLRKLIKSTGFFNAYVMSGYFFLSRQSRSSSCFIDWLRPGPINSDQLRPASKIGKKIN